MTQLFAARNSGPDQVPIGPSLMLLHSRLQFRVLGPLSVLVLAYLLSLYLTPLAPHGQQAAL